MDGRPSMSPIDWSWDHTIGHAALATRLEVVPSIVVGFVDENSEAFHTKAKQFYRAFWSSIVTVLFIYVTPVTPHES